MDNDITGGAEWSGGSLYLLRIHLAFMDSAKYSMVKDYNSQLSSLFIVHREIVAQMKETKDDKEMTEAEKLYKECERVIAFKKGDAKLLVWKLYEYEKFLRIVLKNRRMDIPRGQDTSKVIL